MVTNRAQPLPCQTPTVWQTVGVFVYRAAWVITGFSTGALVLLTAITFLSADGTLDYVEGVTLGHHLMLAEGEPLYAADRTQPPYSVALYGPVFYALNSLLLSPDNLSLVTSRSLNRSFDLILFVSAVQSS